MIVRNLVHVYCPGDTGIRMPQYLTDRCDGYVDGKEVAPKVMSQVMECQRLRETGPLLHPFQGAVPEVGQ